MGVRLLWGFGCGRQVPSHYHTCDLYRIMRAYKAKEALGLDNLQQGESAVGPQLQQLLQPA